MTVENDDCLILPFSTVVIGQHSVVRKNFPLSLFIIIVLIIGMNLGSLFYSVSFNPLFSLFDAHILSYLASGSPFKLAP